MAETTRHREAFERYWRLGAKRSIERLYQAMQAEGNAPSIRTLYDWSSRYDWQQRLLDLERKARASGDVTRIDAVREMQERHAREGVLLQQVGAQALSSMDATTLNADDAIRAIKEGVAIERLARGEPTARTEVTEASNPRLEVLTDDELERLLAHVHASVAGVAPPAPGGPVQLGDGEPHDP